MPKRNLKNKIVLVQLTSPDKIDLTGRVIELYYGHGMNLIGVAGMTGLNVNQVKLFLKKYKSRQGTHDIVVTIISKV